MTPIWKKRTAPTLNRRITTSSTSPRSTTLTILRVPSASHAEVRSSTTPCCLCRVAPHRSICTARTTRRVWRFTPGSQRPDHGEVRRPALPDYYNFVRGVVDSADVTLNISRETLQQNRQLKAIAKRVEKKITTPISRTCATTTARHTRSSLSLQGRGLKYGIYSSYGMKADELARHRCWKPGLPRRDDHLAEYAKGHARGSKAIYYATGDSRERLCRMPVVKGVLEHCFPSPFC